jgi:hypothetical protein
MTTHHGIGALLKYFDNMKQPAAILVLPVLYTILVLPIFYQNLPVSAILVQILVNTSFPVSSATVYLNLIKEPIDCNVDKYKCIIPDIFT